MDNNKYKLARSDSPQLNASGQYSMERLKFGEEGKYDKPKPKASWQLFYAAITVNLASAAAGSIQTWLSPALPYLTSNQTHLPHPVDHQDEGWIGSLAALGSAIGPIPAGLLADAIGRHHTLLLNAVIMLISWILATAATGTAGLAMIMIARLIGGIAVGAVYTVVPMYIGEISTPDLRATLGTVFQLILCLGFLVPYCSGPWVDYVLLGVISAIPIGVFVIAFYFSPESPNYLLSKGRRPAAEKSLRWLRGGCDISDEMNGLEESLQKNPRKSYSEQLRSLISSRACRRGIEIGFACVGFQQFSGINAVLFFGQSIFADAGISMSPAIATIIIGFTLTAASLLGSVLTAVVSTRILLFASSLGLVITNVIMTVYFSFKQNTDVSEFGWVPVATLMLYIIVYCIGWGPLPWAIIGEVFPQDVKGLASGICATFCWILGFLITRFFGDINRALGFHVTFGIFAVFCLLSLIYTFFRIPNTKGKTLQEIQDMFNS